jgi:hypothetical protein
VLEKPDRARLNTEPGFFAIETFFDMSVDTLQIEATEYKRARYL